MVQGPSQNRKRPDETYTAKAKSLQKTLEEELNRIQGRGLACDMKVKWVPEPKSDRHGEVKNGVVYVYDLIENVAIKTLKHEVIDYHITTVLSPLVGLINILIKCRENDAYQEKERLVDRLSNLI